jgi:hypothetical protein
MRVIRKIVAALLAAAAIPAAHAATLGGADYAVQYDYREFFWISDGKPFQVVFSGNPFPEMNQGDVARRLLPVMQRAKPRPALTFTYDKPGEDPRPYYRVVFVFDPALDFGATRACNDPPQFRPGKPGRVYVFAIYCRNDIFLSQTTGWTDASGPEDPRVYDLFKDLFAVIFNDSLMMRLQRGPGNFR